MDQQYKPGDVVNGHILTETNGWQPWVPPVTEQPKKKHTGRNIVLGIIAACVLIGVISAAGGGGDEPTAKDKGGVGVSTDTSEKAEPKPAAKKDKPKPKPKRQVIGVSAKQILDEFEANEAAADAKYKGKDIAVTGIVDKIDTELFNDDEYVVQVGPGGDFVLFTVNCDDQTAETAAKIKKGQRVTVTGDFEDGGDLGVEMHGCKIS